MSISPSVRRTSVALGAVLALAALTALCFEPHVQALARSWTVSALKDELLRWGPWAWALSTFLMVLQAFISPLPAFVITIANGFVFGWFWGGVLALLSATFAAQLCFEVARALGRPALERWVGGTALDWADAFFIRHGGRAILIARLLPFVPFDPISYGAGLTTTSRSQFLTANLAGQIPATFVYSTLGSQLEGGRLPWPVLAGMIAVAAAVAFVGWRGVRGERREGRRDTDQ